MPSAAYNVVKKVLRPIYAPPRTAFQYVRALKIAGAYQRQYREARDAYVRDGNQTNLLVPSLDKVGVRVLASPGTPPVIDLPPAFDNLRMALAGSVAERLARTSEVLFLPAIDRASVPPRTADVPAVKNGDVISLQLKDPLSLPHLEEFARAILPEIERRFYGSYVLVDKVYVYRNLATRQAPQVSWLWHYDNHPTEVLKLMVYLTDVTERTAPFEFVRRRESGDPWMMTARPLLGNSRVSREKVEAAFHGGYESHLLTGPAGTVVLFDDNVVHRATVATEAYRDVLVLQIRPSTFRPERYIDQKYTGSFSHVDVNNDPYDYSARAKTTKMSA